MVRLKFPRGKSLSSVSRAWVRTSSRNSCTALGRRGAICASRISSYQGDGSRLLGDMGLLDTNGGGPLVLRRLLRYSGVGRLPSVATNVLLPVSSKFQTSSNREKKKQSYFSL